MSIQLGNVARARRNQKTMAYTVIVVALLVSLVPLASMLDFSYRFPLTGKIDFSAWEKIFTGQTSEFATLEPMWQGLANSLIMAVMTVVIMLALLLPTMVWVRLKLPRLNRIVEFICLLPLTIPAVVLVVGLGPIYRFIASNVLDSNAIWLAFAYVILVLPYSYRSLDSGLRAIDVKTLSEAARSFGASWPTVLLRVIMPNIRSAVLSSMFIAVAVVLGEFTIARLLGRLNLQTALFQVNLSDAQVAAAMSLLMLVLTTALLIALDLVVSRKPRQRQPDPDDTPATPSPAAAVPPVTTTVPADKPLTEGALT